LPSGPRANPGTVQTPSPERMSLLESFGAAVRLIARGDAEVWHVTAVSLQVSVAALILAAVVGLPTGYAVAVARPRVAAFGSWMLHTMTAFPTVVVGLTLYFALSAAGPLGWMDLLYTRAAMVAGQFVLAVPILAALVLTAIRTLPVEAHETAITLGVGRVRRMELLLGERRSALASGLLIAFARIFTELGAAVILGGNIRGETRTLTTVIALEYAKGDDARAIAMGLILLAVALGINGFVHGAAWWRAERI
jgi:tungstate transport system permease protein